MSGGTQLQASHDLRSGGISRTARGGTELVRRSGMVERLLRSVLECPHQRSAKEQLRLENRDRPSQRGRRVSRGGALCLLPHRERGLRGSTGSWRVQNGPGTNAPNEYPDRKSTRL